MLLDPRTKLLILSITMPFHGNPRILALAGKRTPDGFKIRNSLYCVIDSTAAGDIEIARYVRGHHIYV